MSKREDLRQKVLTRLEGLLPLEGGGHRFELDDEPPGPLSLDDQSLWLHLRHHWEPGPLSSGSLELLPAEALDDELWALDYASGWAAALGGVLQRGTRETLRWLSIGALDRRRVSRRKPLRSSEEVEQALTSSRELGRFAPPAEALGDQGRKALSIASKLLAELLPIQQGFFEIAMVLRTGSGEATLTTGALGSLMASVWLIVREDFDGRATVRDLKEQQLQIAPSDAHRTPERLAPFLRGWAAAVEKVFAEAPADRVEVMMPSDLVAPEVFLLSRPQTAEDFRDAFLTRGRLGRWLG